MKKMQRQLENYFGNYKENTLFIKADVSNEKADYINGENLNVNGGIFLV